MSLKWSPAMNTGMRQVDLQHQDLIEMLNVLEAEHAAGRTEQALSVALPKLAAYVLFHFGTEEALMATLDDDTGHVAAHLEEHRDFTRRVERLTSHPMAPGELPAFIAFLNEWLARHIMQTDRQLGLLLAQADASTRSSN